MLFWPRDRLLPLTVRTAVPVLPDTVTVALPSKVLPIANDTLPVCAPLPVGTLVPAAAFTVAVRTVTELCAIAARLAVTAVLVAIAGGATVTVTAVDVDPSKLL